MIAVVVFIPTEDGRRASGSEFGTACMVGGVKDLRLRGPAGQTDFLRGLPPTTTCKLLRNAPIGLKRHKFVSL